jgi:hypothetical protein
MTMPSSAAVMPGMGAVLDDLLSGTEPEDGADPAVPPRFSENELALLFSAQHAEHLIYAPEQGQWLRWEAGRWCEDHAVTVFTEARKLCAREAATARQTLSAGRATTVASNINKASCIAAIERLARHSPDHVRLAETFDAGPLTLNGRGGFVAL